METARQKNKKVQQTKKDSARRFVDMLGTIGQRKIIESILDPNTDNNTRIKNANRFLRNKQLFKNILKPAKRKQRRTILTKIARINCDPNALLNNIDSYPDLINRHLIYMTQKSLQSLDSGSEKVAGVLFEAYCNIKFGDEAGQYTTEAKSIDVSNYRIDLPPSDLLNSIPPSESGAAFVGKYVLNKSMDNVISNPASHRFGVAKYFMQLSDDVWKKHAGDWPINKLFLGDNSLPIPYNIVDNPSALALRLLRDGLEWETLYDGASFTNDGEVLLMHILKCKDGRNWLLDQIQSNEEKVQDEIRKQTVYVMADPIEDNNDVAFETMQQFNKNADFEDIRLDEIISDLTSLEMLNVIDQSPNSTIVKTFIRQLKNGSFQIDSSGLLASVQNVIDRPYFDIKTSDVIDNIQIETNFRHIQRDRKKAPHLVFKPLVENKNIQPLYKEVFNQAGPGLRKDLIELAHKRGAASTLEWSFKHSSQADNTLQHDEKTQKGKLFVDAFYNDRTDLVNFYRNQNPNHDSVLLCALDSEQKSPAILRRLFDECFDYNLNVSDDVLTICFSDVSEERVEYLDVLSNIEAFQPTKHGMDLYKKVSKQPEENAVIVEWFKNNLSDEQLASLKL